MAKRSETSQLCWTRRGRLPWDADAAGGHGTHLSRGQAAGWVKLGCYWLLSPSQQTDTLLVFALFREGCEFLGIAPLLLFLPRPLPPSFPSLLAAGSFANLIVR